MCTMLKATPDNIERGTQIAYIPSHADGSITHKDVEFGFVTSLRGDSDTVFCRYWNKTIPILLRTKANSEGTSINDLVLFDFRPQELVDKLLEQIDAEQIIREY